MLPENKSVLITGGTGGIGTHLVAKLHSRGARVTVASRDAGRHLPNVEYIPVDLSSPDAVYDLGATFSASPPDILINLAGINAFGEFESMPRTQLHTLMQVNLLAPMQLVHGILPSMISRGSGQIVNIGSVLGNIGLPYFTAYATSKAGMERFSESLRRELAGRNITVTHIAPRAVKTRMNHGVIEEFNQRSGTRADTPEYVANLIVEAITKDKPKITIGFPERLFVKINALAPSLVDRSLNRNRRLAEEMLATQSL